MLKIICAPNNVLNQPVKPVKKIDDRIRKLIFKMEKTLVAQTDPPGVGLAAPQVGEKLALFIIKPTKKAKTMVFVNPRIIKQQKIEDRRSKIGKNLSSNRHLQNQPSTIHPLSSRKHKHSAVKLEGCLSIPRIWGLVNRAKRVLVQYQDLTGKKITRWFRGLPAIIIQHEVDHLHGTLFTQRTLEQKLPLFEEKDGELEKIDY